MEQKELLESNTTLADTVNALIEEVVDETKITTKKRKMDKLENQLSNNSIKIDSEIDWFKTNDVCPSCQQDINDGHKNCIVEEKGKKKDELTDAIASLNEEMLAVRAKLDIINEKKETLYDTKNIMHNNVVKIDFIQKNIDGLEADIDDTENNNTNVKKLEKELKQLNAELKSLDTVRGELVDDKNYFTVAGQFLKDTGVKTSIIKYYLPIMNKLINRYLQEMDFYINFTMDERFVENIKSRGREGFTYSSFSEGEKMRVDLALLFTWREIARMKNSVNTNLLVLDEVFDSSLDATGTDEFLKLLNTLGGNNVFVISHKGDILFDKFNETVKFEKVKNFSQIAVE